MKRLAALGRHFAAGRRAGFGLVEILVSIGLLSLVVMETTRFFTQAQKTMQQNRTYGYRDILVSEMARLAADGKALMSSAAFPGASGLPSNAVFRDCVNGGGAGCPAGVDQDLVLTDSFGNVVAGTPLNPVYYDLYGQPCTGGPKPSCGIQAYTSFKADCGAAPSPCPRARAVNVTFTVRQAPGIILAPLANLQPFTATFASQIPLYVTRNPGTVNHLPVWTTNTDLGDSIVVQAEPSPAPALPPITSFFGVNTASPLATLHPVGLVGNMSNVLVESTSAASNAPRLGLVDTLAGTVTSAPVWYAENRQDLFRLYRQPDLVTPGKDLLQINNQGSIGISPLVMGGVLNMVSDQPLTDGQNDITNTTYSDSFSADINLKRAGGTLVAPKALLAGQAAGSLLYFSRTSAGDRQTGAFQWVASTPLDGVTDTGMLNVQVTNAVSGGPGLMNAMFVWGDGKVGFNSPSNTDALQVGGNIRVQGTGNDCIIGNGTGATSCSSDERLKENVSSIPNALARVLRMRGVEFDWNSLASSPGRHDSGVIAQEVEAAFPSAVARDGETGYRRVDYAALTAPLIEAYRSLHAMCGTSAVEIEKVRNEVGTLRASAAAHQRRLAGLASENKKISARNALLRARLAELERSLGWESP